MFDFITLGETMLRLSPPNFERIAQAVTLDMRFGGTESNVAVALARLGFKSAWLSRLPDNPLGHRVLMELRAHNVDVSGVRLAANERLGTYYIEFGSVPRPNRVVYDRANSAISRMTTEEVAFDQIEKSRWLHLTGITPALSQNCYDLVLACAKFGKSKGIPVSFDVNYRALLWSAQQAGQGLDPILRHCDVIFSAHRDAQNLFGASASAEKAATELRERFDCKQLVLTIGEEGAIAQTANETAHQPAFNVPNPVDRIGAGDAFDAGYIAAQLRGQSLEDALRFGNAMSALKMTMTGDLALISQAEVDAVLAGAKVISVR
jgi:2-dehydro-3-deoxygluconokinase